MTDNADRQGRDERAHFMPIGTNETARLVTKGLREAAPRLTTGN